MVKNSIINLIKRTLLFGVGLILMLSVLLIFNGDVMMVNPNLMLVLSVIAISAFIVFLVWSTSKVLEQGEDDEMFP